MGMFMPNSGDESEGYFWRIILGFPYCTAIIQLWFLIVFFPRETPRFSALMDNRQEVKYYLSNIKDKDCIDIYIYRFS